MPDNVLTPALDKQAPLTSSKANCFYCQNFLEPVKTGELDFVKTGELGFNLFGEKHLLKLLF